GGAVGAGDLLAEAAGQGVDAAAEAVGDPAQALGVAGGDLVGVAAGVGEPLVHLRDVAVEHAGDGVDFFGDVDDHVRGYGAGLAGVVGEGHDHGVAWEVGRGGADGGDGDHVGGVLDQPGGVAVVGGVVGGAVGDHQVGAERADQPDQA